MFYIKIDDFVEALNYHCVILHIDESVSRSELKDALNKNQVNHMSRFDDAWDDKFFYIENCDLQTLNGVRIEEVFSEWDWNGRWSVLNLVKTKRGLAIVVPDPIYWNGPILEE